MSMKILQAKINPINPGRDAWIIVEKLFHDQVSSRIFELNMQFQNLKKKG